MFIWVNQHAISGNEHATDLNRPARAVILLPIVQRNRKTHHSKQFHLTHQTNRRHVWRIPVYHLELV